MFACLTLSVSTRITALTTKNGIIRDLALGLFFVFTLIFLYFCECYILFLPNKDKNVPYPTMLYWTISVFCTFCIYLLTFCLLNCAEMCQFIVRQSPSLYYHHQSFSLPMIGLLLENAILILRRYPLKGKNRENCAEKTTEPTMGSIQSATSEIESLCSNICGDPEGPTDDEIKSYQSQQINNDQDIRASNQNDDEQQQSITSNITIYNNQQTRLHDQTPQSRQNQTATQRTIDFAIFQSEEECDTTKPDMNSCQCINRVIHSLSYYTALNTESNKEGRETFVDFIQNIYPNYLNDIIHLTTIHDQDLQKIHLELFSKYGFKKCDIKSCILTDRHYRGGDRTNNNGNHNKIDPMFLHYQNEYDSLHHYIVHLFDLGLRTMINDGDDNKINDDIEMEQDLSLCFDAERMKCIRNIRIIINIYFIPTNRIFNK